MANKKATTHYVNPALADTFLSKSKKTKQKRKPFLSKSKKLIFGFSIVILLFVAQPVYEFASLSIASANASSDIKDIADKSGFNSRGKRLFYKASPELVDADELQSVCPSDSSDSVEFGCYLPDKNKIYILYVSDQDYKYEEYTTAAHEVLHEAWNELTSEERGVIAGELDKYYNDPSNQGAVALKETMKSYPTDDPTLYSELHSFIGSEATYMSSELESHYAQYFSSRSAPVQADIDFNNALDLESKAIDEESARLDEQSAKIDQFRVDHLDSFDRVFARAEYYGDVDNYNDNVERYNKNLEIYNPMVDAYKAAVNTFNIRVDSYNGLLASFKPSAAPISTKAAPTQQVIVP